LRVLPDSTTTFNNRAQQPRRLRSRRRNCFYPKTEARRPSLRLRLNAFSPRVRPCFRAFLECSSCHDISRGFARLQIFLSTRSQRAPGIATEWWYYTGHLRSSDGRRFGYQLTWFRTALKPTVKRASKWAARDVMFAHFALTDERGQKFYFSDRIGRAGAGGNGADSNSKSPRIWCGPWDLKFSGARGEIQKMQAFARSDASSTKDQSFSLQLSQRALKPPIAHGLRGVSQKSAGVGRASHYYSFTRLQTSGTLRIGKETLRVEGQSWFDHEFGSSQLSKIKLAGIGFLCNSATGAS
jgi:predicted secreted hydrolase